MILCDSQFTHLLEGTKLPTILSYDTAKPQDPYEDFLANGRHFSQEKGWDGLEMEGDENANAILCYTFVAHSLVLVAKLTCSLLGLVLREE